MKFASILFPIVVFAQPQNVSVLMGNYDLVRSGANANEVSLTQASAASVKKLGVFTLDANTMAQPLIVSGYNIGTASRIMIAVTLNNSIYAFDADRPGSSFLWKVTVGSVISPGDTDLYSQSIGCVPTPVADRTNGIVYAVCVDNDTATSRWRLYSLNLVDGSTHHAPATLTGTSHSHTFDPVQHLSRVALTLANGNVYTAFASYFDATPYQGWVFANDASSLASVAAWADVDTGGSQGGIWMANGGISVDNSGNLYLITGNGTCNSGSDANFGNALMKLSSTLSVLDWMQPSNCSTLNGADTDLGANRAMLINNTPVMGGGKDGRWWVLDPGSSFGHINSGSPNFTAAGAIFNGAIWSAALNRMYLGPTFGSTARKLYRFDWNGTTFSANGTSSTTYAFPGHAGMALSSNGSVAGSAVIWATTCTTSGDQALAAGTLRAYNADTLAEIWNSDTSGTDTLGNITKFTEPTVANGKVYVPTHSSQIVVYGVPPLGTRKVTGSARLSGSAMIK